MLKKGAFVIYTVMMKKTKHLKRHLRNGTFIAPFLFWIGKPNIWQVYLPHDQ